MGVRGFVGLAVGVMQWTSVGAPVACRHLFLQFDGFRFVCLIILYRASAAGGLVIFRPTCSILKTVNTHDVRFQSGYGRIIRACLHSVYRNQLLPTKLLSSADW